jgi:ABC-type bacteriocin/lantibiotic exporter with double-glycine peptidase domain
MSGAGPTASSLSLPAGSALVVHRGEALVFVARTTAGGRGRWVPVRQVKAPGVVRGADLPEAEVIVSLLPGADYAVVALEELEEAQRSSAEDVGPLAQAALAVSAEEARHKAQADELQRQHDAWAIRDALTDLADSVPGHSDASAADDAAADVTTVRRLASLIGLPADPVRLRSAVADAQVSGRDRITALAAACDASIRRFSLPPGWWRTQGPPLLVTVRDTGVHRVASWQRGRYQLWDPQTSHGEPIDETSASRLASTGLLLQPLLDPSRAASVGDLLRLGTRGTGGAVAALLLATAAIGLLSAVIPVVTARLTTAAAEAADTSLLAVGAALVLVVVATIPLATIRGYALRRIRTQAVSTAAIAVWDRQLRLPMTWHKDRRLNARIVDATSVDTASGKATDGTVFTLLDTVAVAGSVLGAFIVSPWIAIVIVLVLVVRGSMDIYLVRRLQRVSREVVDEDATSPVLELLRGSSRLRASGAIDRAYARWGHFAATVVRVKAQVGRISTAQQVSAALWPALSLALMFWVVDVTMADESEAYILGVIVAAQIALTSANSSLSAAISAVGGWLTARAVLQRSESILTALPESAGGGEMAPLRGGIDLRGVVYRYAPDLPPIFDGLDLTIRPGEHLALVGPSGTGKTTLLRLILGLDEPETGLVAFDGKALTALDRSAVRRQIGVVMQSSALLPGTLRDNVDLGRGLSTDEVWAALDRSAVGDDVRAMPNGIDTVVVEGGSGISGGQRQRILLARALAGDPRILVLDEATSALDNVSQAAIVANLDRMPITRIVVAHRLSTIRRADRIAVLDAGRIVQEGSYDELIAVAGPFRTLVERQSVDGLTPVT